MPVRAITPDYAGDIKDRVENFHGNQMVYVGWDRHLLFAAPFTLLAQPDMPFRRFRDELMGSAFDPHPDWEQIDWSRVSWLLNDEPFEPQLDKSLQEQGVNHKYFLRFQTPGLNGIAGAGV